MKAIKEIGNIKVYIEESYEQMGVKAADILEEELKINLSSVFGLATGSTPISLYEEMIRRYQNGKLDFNLVKTFNLDEYYPMKKSNNQSYDYFMREKLFNHINMKDENINIPNGEAEDPVEECLRYEEKLTAAGEIDVQILGMGINGHIGFNEPNNSFSGETNYVDLAPSTIEANARFFQDINDVPKKAITMGIGNIMQAKKIVLLVNSPEKASVLREALFGEVKPEIPASALQLHKNISVIITEDVAQLLFSEK